MGKVVVDFYFAVKKVVGQPKIELEMQDATLKSLLDELAEKFGNKFNELLFDQNKKVKPFFNIMVNGRQYQYLPGGLDVRLNDGDVVSIFSPVAGG